MKSKQLSILTGIGLVVLFSIISFTSYSCKGSGGQEGTDAQTEESVTEADEESKVVELTSTSFRTKVYDYIESPDKFTFKGDRPAVIDFYADWCGPCRKLAPKLAKLAKDYEGKIDVYKVDTDQETEIAKFFDISSIPLVFFVPMTGEPIKVLGNAPQEELEAKIAEILK